MGLALQLLLPDRVLDAPFVLGALPFEALSGKLGPFGAYEGLVLAMRSPPPDQPFGLAQALGATCRTSDVLQPTSSASMPPPPPALMTQFIADEHLD